MAGVDLTILDERENLFGWLRDCQQICCAATNDSVRASQLFLTVWDKASGQLWTLGYWNDFFLGGCLALDVAKTMHNLSAQAQILGELGWVCMEWEDYTTASQYFAEALQHYQALQDDRCQCRMLRYLGVLSHRQQQLDAALDYYQQAWEIVKMNCDRVPFDDKWAFQAAELPNLTGCIYLDRQDFPSSHRDLTLSLENYRLLGQQWEKYRYYQADPLLNLGRLYFRQGDRDRARKYYQDCLQLCQDISRPDTMAGVLLHLATLAEAEHNYTEAVRLTSESERIAGTEIPALREQAARFKERLLTESADKFNSLG